MCAARRIAFLSLCYLIGAGAGWLFARLGVPLPWIVGPLVAIGAISAVLGAPAVGTWHRWAGQLVIAGAVGLNLTPAALSNIIANLAPMLVAAAATIALAVGLASTLVRLRGVDRATALFASLPGGPIDMAVMAQHYGGNPGVVAFSQTVRVAVTVIVIPPI